MSNAPKPTAPAAFGMILVTPNDKLRKWVDTAIAAVSKLKKVEDHVSESAARSRYETTEGRLVVNVPAEHMVKALGPHVAVLALTVWDTMNAATLFSSTMRRGGFTAHVHHKLEPEYPMLSFVTVKDLPGIAFLMWPKTTPPPSAPGIQS